MQIVSFYVFSIKKGKKWRAFTKMATLPFNLNKVKGCTFSKMMGSGHGQGFSIKPNFGVYAAMMVWESKEDLVNFENHNESLQKYLVLVDELKKIYATPYIYHGSWDNQTPFNISENNFSSVQKLVLTRATIKFSKLFHFWKHVPKTSKAIENASGRIYSIGIGELPWVQQATLSIWESEEAMKNYAYSNQAHLEAIKLTKSLKWYKEEMFTRFHIISDIESLK
jgi:heme-degrading monooxygenase HmoA